MKTLIKRAHIHPITKPDFIGDVLIQGSKILQMDKDIEVNTNEEIHIINANGQKLYPGFIDAHTHLGLYDEGTGWAGNDANETVEPLTPHIRAIDGVYPLDKGFEDARRQGITTVQVMPGSANVIGGITSVIKTTGKNIEDMIVKHPAALKMALGENPKKMHSGNKDITRMGVAAMIREAFTKAKEGRRSFHNEALHCALNNEIPVRIHAHRADDILTALRIADEFGLNVRIEHCTEGHLIHDELSKRDGLHVTVGPTMTRRSKLELRNKSWEVYRSLVDAGVNVSITTDHPYTPVQHLPVCAAIAVREGLTVDEAMRAITINPAFNLGVQDRVGSIEIGKDADLVLWDEHPFHFTAKPLWTMINGQVVYQR
ncbi:amidohydrolase [Priestia megaterium]|nr:amidohydrolase [Priestia megaterium]